MILLFFQMQTKMCTSVYEYCNENVSKQNYRQTDGWTEEQTDG